jgi:hypothetical protein
VSLSSSDKGEFMTVSPAPLINSSLYAITESALINQQFPSKPYLTSFELASFLMKTASTLVLSSF